MIYYLSAEVSAVDLPDGAWTDKKSASSHRM